MQILLLFLVLASSGLHTASSFELAYERLCKGVEISRRTCPQLPKCVDNCDPQDCQFASWGEWTSLGNCSGLQERTRTLQTLANECGQQCDGALAETRYFLDDECNNSGTPVNCVFSDWEDWQACDDGETRRVRHEATAAQFGGSQCEGNTSEVASCNDKEAQDCTVSLWADWTDCSTSCGVGRQTRARHFTGSAKYGGLPCNDSLYEGQVCHGTEPCGGTLDCQVSSWSDWSGCNDTSPVAKVRVRSIVLPRRGDDAVSCDMSLKESMSCESESQSSNNCSLGDWSDWSACDKACGGGQTFKVRQVVDEQDPTRSCGQVDFKEVEPCNTDECDTGEDNCVLSDWSDWSSCTASCGAGQVSRTREVVQQPTAGGRACLAPLNETESCSGGACPDQACEWEDWSTFSDCSRTCGEGLRTRAREVRHYPLDGSTCDVESMQETESCNDGPCEDSCADDEWGDWGDWSDCSVTCGTGYSSRNRSLAVNGEPCGQRALGPIQEFQPCEEEYCSKRNCSFSEWLDWGDCDKACKGMQIRWRQIHSYAAQGGACCDGPLKEATACNWDACDDGGPLSQCSLSDWTPWSECSESCGGGQQSRSRDLTNRPCVVNTSTMALTESTPCNEQACEGCQDCEWSDWSEWSTCVGCSNGQRNRSRSIVQAANYCGTPCAHSSAAEVASCVADCGEAVAFCAWTDWSEAEGSCTATCGEAVMSRTRQLNISTEALDEGQYLFRLDSENTSCSGEDEDLVSCEGLSPCNCVAVDCELSFWSDWSAPTCGQLCYRTRDVEVAGTECGKPCEDSTVVETKECSVNCTDEEIELGCTLWSWSAWSVCQEGTAQSTEQRSRFRGVLAAAVSSGLTCSGAVQETEGCSANPEVRNCELSEWSSWSTCSQDCDGGHQKRERFVRNRALGGGEGCIGALTEVQACNPDSCNPALASYQCHLTPWAGWSACLDGQRTRQRSIAVSATPGELNCSGALLEVEPCTSKPQQCVMSDWVNWGPCDRTCDSGQQQRHRQVQVLPSPDCTNETCQCPENIIDFKACEDLQPCSTEDCETDSWSSWSPCSATCGSGQKTRSRDFLKLASGQGLGCREDLLEVAPCEASEPCVEDVNCTWADWSAWENCSQSCGGGMQQRTREIASHPSGDGEKCGAEVMSEVQPCNTEACLEDGCVDGAWDEWSEWDRCTASCQGGLRVRHRSVARPANHCGQWPKGPFSEYDHCNQDVKCWEDVDCQISEWAEWSTCSKSCYGIRHRQREVSAEEEGNGTACHGAISELESCNPDFGEHAPSGCHDYADEDCVYSAWAEWKECSASCGTGERYRHRKVLARGPEGITKPCKESLVDLQECKNMSGCSGNESVGVDCVWDEWSDWSECTKATGQTSRTRSILTMNHGSGKACDLGATQETRGCTERGQAHAVFCSWSSWEEWGDCSATCGAGTMERRRHLQVASTNKSNSSEAGTIQEWSRDPNLKMEANRRSSTRQFGVAALAFAAGAASLALTLGLFRLRTSSFLQEAMAGLPRPSHDSFQLIASAADPEEQLLE